MKYVDHDPNMVIDALGGTRKVAKIFDISDASVSGWRNDGIPKARFDLLAIKFKKKLANLSCFKRAA